MTAIARAVGPLRTDVTERLATEQALLVRPPEVALIHVLGEEAKMLAAEQEVATAAE